MPEAVGDKVLDPLGGVPPFARCLRAFAASGAVATYAVVYRDADQRERLAGLAAAEDVEPIWVPGGPRRQDSVAAGLEAIPASVDHVFIHDCARPLLHPGAIQALARAAAADGAACLAHPVTDTVKAVEAEADPGGELLQRCHLRDLDRRTLWAMETPQVFSRTLILEAYRRVQSNGEEVTDDTAAATLAGHRVTLVSNPRPNPKLTTAQDIAYAEFLLTADDADAT